MASEGGGRGNFLVGLLVAGFLIFLVYKFHLLGYHHGIIGHGLHNG